MSEFAVIEGLLSGPDYFRCERFRCLLSKWDCVKRQARECQVLSAFAPTSALEMSFEACQGCEQGREISESVKRGTGEAVNQGGEGKKGVDLKVISQWYKKGPATPAGKAWKKENRMEEQSEYKRVVMCKRCGEKPAVLRRSGKVLNGLCGQCRMEITYENQRKREVAAGGHPPEDAILHEDPFLAELGKLFAEYPEVMETLENAAKRDVRSLAEQAIYCVRVGLMVAD